MERKRLLSTWNSGRNVKVSAPATTRGLSGGMEPAGMKAIFQRSPEKSGVQYTEYIGGGDAKTFHVLSTSDIYPALTISKIGCTVHVQKRMGGRMRKLKIQLGKTPLSDGEPKDVRTGFQITLSAIRSHLEKVTEASERRRRASELQSGRGKQERGGMVSLISKTTVNRIISVRTTMIKNEISKEVQEGGMFSVQLDTTKDISGSHHLRDIFLRDIPSARHFNCAISHLRDTPSARQSSCATFQLRDFAVARHPICATFFFTF